MQALSSVWRQIYLGFFASHIVFTLVVDSQAIVPPHWIPSPCRALLAFYVSSFHDPLFQPDPSSSSSSSSSASHLLWFQALVVCELLFQLPFFVLACRTLYQTPPPSSSNENGPSSYSDTFRVACIAYGAHTTTSLVPILFTLALGDHTATFHQRSMLLLLYAPYLILPLILLIHAIQPSPSPGGKNVGDGVAFPLKAKAF